MTDPTFPLPSSPPPFIPLRPTTAMSAPSPLRCLTPTRCPVPAIQSPSHLRGTCPPPFDFDARERLLAVLSLGWVRALVAAEADGDDSVRYSDELMFRLWLSCDGLVDSLLLRLTRLKPHARFETLGALVADLTAQHDSRRLPALQVDEGRPPEWSEQRHGGAVGRAITIEGSLVATVARAGAEWRMGGGGTRWPLSWACSRPGYRVQGALPALAYMSTTRSPSASPTLSFSPSMSPSFHYTALSQPSSPTPSPPSRAMLPLLTAMPPLTRSVSAQSSVTAVVRSEAGRPFSRQRQRSWTRSDVMLDSVSLDEVVPVRRLQQPQVSMVREEDES